jgi:dTMP kinase
MIRKITGYELGIFMDGKLIVLEGVEGSGKTTQVAAIADWLRLYQSRKVITTREPGGTSLGKYLRQLLLQEEGIQLYNRTELCLYAADRIQHLEEIIKPALDQGMIVLCDRFTASTIAYQGYGRGLDQGLITQFNNLATQGLQPNITLWLSLDVQVGLQRVQLRGERDRLEKADLTFHQRVQQGYQELATQNPATFIAIDANQSPELVTQEIQRILQAQGLV